MLIEFKDNFFGGTRSNRYRISGTFPTGGGFTDFHVRATTIPQAASRTISYDYFGRKYHYPGEKDYGTWSFVVWDDTGNNNLWGRFQKWQDFINNHDTNISAVNSRDYKADNWTIQHLDLNGNVDPLKQWTLNGCWPAGIQPINLNMGNPNVLNTFNVIIVFDYIQIKDITANI
jgi:hypothetical protein